MSFQDLSAELTGQLPGLSPFLADSFIQRAWRHIRDEKLWSFLQADGAVICPTQVTSGTFSITQFATTVTADATASAALLALPATPGLTSLQIRFPASSTISGGQIYSITAVDQTAPAAIVLTLDRFVVEDTNASASYQCYRCYVRPPEDDFLTWQSFVDMANAWPLQRNRTSSYFDLCDPQRTAQGLAYFVGAYKGENGSLSRPQYELWPHPTSGQTFYVRYRQRGVDFADPTEVLPPGIPDQLVLLRAFGWDAYPWAAKNVGHFPDLRGAGWVALTVQAQKDYMAALAQAKKQDEEEQSSWVLSRGHGLRPIRPFGRDMMPYPIDADFLQSHLVRF